MAKTKRVQKHPEAPPELAHGAIRPMRYVAEQLGIPHSLAQSIETTAMRKVRRAILEDPELVEFLAGAGLSIEPRRRVHR